MELCVSLALPGIPEGSGPDAELPASNDRLGNSALGEAGFFDRRLLERSVVARLGPHPGARGHVVTLRGDGEVADAVVPAEGGTSHATRARGPDERPGDEELLQSFSLEQLMSAYVAGSERAFDELYRRLTPKVYGYLLRLARKPERAEDLVQVTYSKVHRARASYLDGAPLLPWVLAIARRAFFDESRALRSRREDLTNEGVLPEASPTQAPEQTDIGLLERALAELPETYREAIVLTKITGLSVAEAAAVVDSTSSAVKLRVHRGYKALREAMERLAQADATI